MTEIECKQFLNEVGKKGSVYGLDTIRELLSRLDNPQEKIKIVHIAGTNGKGSILTMIEQAMLEAGYSTGKYISPCLGNYGEQFLYNQIPISKEELFFYMDRIKVVSFKMQEEGFALPTLFEIETAFAFLYFFEKKVDLLLLETGMGGRLDATNIISDPILVIFSSISKDHMQFLGDSVEEIVREKAGIIKKRVPVVCYPGDEKVLKILHTFAKEKEAPFFVVDKKEIKIIAQDYEKQSFSYRGQKEICIFLPGDHQIYNAATALMALENLKKYYILPEHIIKRAFSLVRWEARLELIKREPLVFLDGAHNEDAAKYLADFIQKHFTNKRITYIIGVLADKDYKKMLQQTVQLAEYSFTVTPDNSRALDADVLAKEIRKQNAKAIAMKSLQEAYRSARKIAQKEDVIIVFGSLSFLGEMKRLIKKEG